MSAEMREAMSEICDEFSRAFPRIHGIAIGALFDGTGAFHLWIHSGVKASDGTDVRIAILKSFLEGIERQIASYEAGLGEISADQGQG